jgi:hypothetical protein
MRLRTRKRIPVETTQDGPFGVVQQERFVAPAAPFRRWAVEIDPLVPAAGPVRVLATQLSEYIRSVGRSANYCLEAEKLRLLHVIDPALDMSLRRYETVSKLHRYPTI